MQLLSKLAQSTSNKPAPLSPDRVRDHLANERTYLAWMRSAIALIGFGVLVVRLRILRLSFPHAPGSGWRVGLLFAVVGFLTIVLSVPHYFSTRNTIETNTYQPPDRWIFLFSSAVLLLGAGVIYYVFAIPFELSGQVLIE
ncbi:DUF202 domain-containing protein (plasmid) [Kovacikia minuta CCNUW1]|uniref:YidH family protein n=1 Tax=Kovacikia minuta TaxID=2931930 RepID=UPI001CC94D36|nr:DUF202 domain-containing protein [Kovacikia minuta]UBF30610.1 DUF202 domain-containing protein [Kovacikia minuta CCNUW1]